MLVTPPILSVAELADVLRVSVRTVRRALAAGTLPIRPLPCVGGGQVRRRWTFAATDVARFLQGAQQRGTWSELARRGRRHSRLEQRRPPARHGTHAGAGLGLGDAVQGGLVDARGASRSQI